MAYFYDLEQALKKLGYVEGTTLFGFSYDWRQDPTGEFIQHEMRECVSRIFALTGKKIRVFAHSMGGIVARQFCI